MAKQDMSELGFSNADVLVTPPEKNNKLESPASDSKGVIEAIEPFAKCLQVPHEALEIAGMLRSEERRVGKECTSWCRSRWSPYH